MQKFHSIIFSEQKRKLIVNEYSHHTYTCDQFRMTIFLSRFCYAFFSFNFTLARSRCFLLGLNVSYSVSMFLTLPLSFILGSISLTRCLSLTLSLPKEFFQHTGREKKSTFNYFPYFFIDKCSTVSFIRSLE